MIVHDKFLAIAYILRHARSCEQVLQLYQKVLQQGKIVAKTRENYISDRNFNTLLAGTNTVPSFAKEGFRNLNKKLPTPEFCFVNISDLDSLLRK